MPDKKNQPAGKPAGNKPEKNSDKPDNSGDKHNAGKEANRQQSQSKKDLDVKNEVTGANLDGQPI